MSIKEIAESYATRVWDDQDLKAIDDLIDESCLIHSLMGDFYGAYSMKKVVEAWLTGFPDLKVKNSSILCDKDMIAIQWQSSGTHLGLFKNIPPTGKKVSYPGITVYRIQGSKIVEYWAYLDMQHLLKQISPN